MHPLKPGHAYQLRDGTVLTFVHRNEDGTLHTTATTTCELIEVLAHRLVELNRHAPCIENDDAIYYLLLARSVQKFRKLRLEAEAKSKETP
ncbi:MAG: hypothetical protein V2A34_02590 [Lentisphaerota bacterium]